MGSQLRLDGAARLVPSAASIEQPLGPGEAQPSFQRTFNPVGALLEPVQGVPEEPAAGAATGPSPADNLNGPLVHRIADGDTLSKLAERYLGRSERYLEIYNANRDVLASPDLLPIGATLRIPPSSIASPRQVLRRAAQFRAMPSPADSCQSRGSR